MKKEENKCPKCGEEKGQQKKGFTGAGSQRMFCNACSYNFEHRMFITYCSYQNGTVSISIRGMDLQVDVLVEELMAILQAGAEARQSLTASQREAYTDAELEEKIAELQTVQWDPADSPSGMITAAPWWIFPQGVDRADLWAWFCDHHSKGEAGLIAFKSSPERTD